MVLNEQVRIPTYRVETELSLMESLSDNKPSKRIIKSKKGLKAIKALIDLEQNHNTSWYNYLKSKNKDNMNKTRLILVSSSLLLSLLLQTSLFYKPSIDKKMQRSCASLFAHRKYRQVYFINQIIL